eukprot:PRCOL_00003809-RA
MAATAARAAAEGAATAAAAPAPEHVLAALRGADAACFDVDSTVCVDEGIDELAAACGAGEAVAAWTAKAMGGSVGFREALAARLSLIEPTEAQLADFLANNPPRLSPGIKELVAALQARGTEVFLVSGGFTQMIRPVSDELGVPHDNIFANTILFHGEGGSAGEEPAGTYAGFDEEAFTSRSGGKAAAVAHIRAARGKQTVLMFGDGATDLEARAEGGADVFIGYGGVVARDVIREGADWFVTSFDPVLEALAS